MALADKKEEQLITGKVNGRTGEGRTEREECKKKINNSHFCCWQQKGDLANSFFYLIFSCLFSKRFTNKKGGDERNSYFPSNKKGYG